MQRTLEAIKKDFQSYSKLAKRQPGATLTAAKYAEDIGSLLELLKPTQRAATPQPKILAKGPKELKPSKKAKTPKAE